MEGAVLYDSLALKANRDRRTLLVMNGGIIHLQLAAGFYVDIVVVISTFCVKGAVFGNEGAALLHIDRAVGQITVCEGGGVPGGNIDDRVGKGHAFRSEIVVVQAEAAAAVLEGMAEQPAVMAEDLFSAEHFHSFSATQYGYKIQNYDRKSIHFHTTCRGL